MYNECFDIWTASCCSCCVDAALWCAGHGLLNTNIFSSYFDVITSSVICEVP